MLNDKQYIIIGLVGIIALMIMFYNKIQIENLEENINVNIGNYLCVYFYRYGLSVLEKKDFFYNVADTNFVRHLPTQITYDEDLYNKFTKKGLTYDYILNIKQNCGECMWNVERDELNAFWSILKPKIQLFMDRAFKESGVNIKIDCPVIHFRCSDTPFEKNRYYHFQKYEFYKKAMARAELKTHRKYSKVEILYCNGHLSYKKQRDSCDVYLQSLVEFIQSLGYKPVVECGSNINDFAKLFYAPAVISNGSSYAFMSGFFGKGVFISAEHQCEDYPHIKCDSCQDWAIHGDNILHKDVDDYYDTAKVISMMTN